MEPGISGGSLRSPGSREDPDILYTLSELEEQINLLVAQHRSLRAVHATITQPDPLDDVELGSASTGDPDSIENEWLDGTQRFRARIEYWFEQVDSTTRSAAQRRVRESLKSWWRGEQRDEKGRILSGQFATLQKSLELTIAERAKTGPVAVVFADIDKFKLWNDQRGPVEGDRIIAKLAASLVRQSGSEAIVIHRTGDEYLIVLPSSSVSQTVAEVIRIRHACSKEVFEEEDPIDGDVQPGLSCGIALVHSPADSSYLEVEARAERALKPDGTKRRGQVSIEASLWYPSESGDRDRRVDVLEMASQISTEEPFHNVWQNVLAHLVEKGLRQDPGNTTITDLVEGVVRQIIPEFRRPDQSEPVFLQNAVQFQLDPLDLVLAIAHGIIRASAAGGAGIPAMRLRFSGSGDCAALYRREEVDYACFLHIQKDADCSDFDDELELPCSGTSAKGATYNSQRAIVITVGPNELGLPKSLFAAEIFVDHRPTAGGGLPDLWEAALAQVVNTVSMYPNITTIILTGDLDRGKQTVGRLENAANWSNIQELDYLAYKLGLPTGPIRAASLRISDNTVRVGSREEAVSALWNAYTSRQQLEPQPGLSSANNPPRLARALQMDTMLLGPAGGCRVDTAFEAFPVALDVARSAAVHPVGLDDSQRQFRELVDYRIVLNRPTVDPIPRFYLGEEAFLDSYFRKEFLGRGGLFHDQLVVNNQLDRVLQHVADTLTLRGQTTRRALLVIPHAPAEGSELAPLGLVSARIIPEWSGAEPMLNFSFSWRTVESIVGLPYSLYGSIRYAEFLTAGVSDRLHSRPIRTPRLGTLSYIAHSLHIFLDEYTQSVARRIINDES